MNKILLLLISLFLFSGFVSNPLPEVSSEGAQTVKLIFAGDIMGHSPQFQAAYNAQTKSYNYETCFQLVKPYIESADIAIANLEVPLAGPPYSGYPNFSSPDALLDGLKYAGYDIILTANNHVVDRGKQGLERTIGVITDRKLKHTGSYINKAQRDSIYPLIIHEKGLRIALLNCTYGTNGIPVTNPNMVNLIDTVQIRKDIARAKKLQADFIIMTIHWGVEYILQANDSQRKLARWLAAKGVNLIIGGHPHVVQDMEIITTAQNDSVPVYYSLGNSVSNQRKPHTDGGIMVEVEIGVKAKKIISTSYIPVYVHRGMLAGKYQYHLIPTPQYIQAPEQYKLAVADSLALRYFDQQTRLRLHNQKVSGVDSVRFVNARN